MAANVFVSYDHDDQLQVQGFKLLKHNPNHSLDFHDHSLKEPVTDKTGRPIKYPPRDPRSKPIRDEIVAKFQNASKLVVLIGIETHTSEWVDWEIRTFFDLKQRVAGPDAWKRIRGMKLKGCDNAALPAALYPDSTCPSRSVQHLSWNPEALDQWLDMD